jgi:hypothetical protein
MTAASWWQDVPDSGTGAQGCILTCIADGVLEHEFVELPVTTALRVFVSRCAATIEGRRIRVSARTQYTLGRELGAWLLTPALADRIDQRATTRLEPKTLGDGHGGPARDMADRSAWDRHDAAIEALGRPLVGLVSGEGKDWVSTPAWSATRAANYGWHRSTGHPWQPLGTAHDWAHTDYSQLARWAYHAALLDGALVELADVIAGRHGHELAHACGGPMASLVPPRCSP